MTTKKTTDTVYADDLPYWKTSTISPDAWIYKAKEEIRRADGKVESEAFASTDNKRAFLLTFLFDADKFVIQWPVLQPKSMKDEMAAKIQAATMLYHDVKSRCINARVMGARTAFMGYLLLDNGQTASQVSNAEYLMFVPKVLMLPSGNET